jgi:hypothetical protein
MNTLLSQTKNFTGMQFDENKLYLLSKGLKHHSHNKPKRLEITGFLDFVHCLVS